MKDKTSQAIALVGIALLMLASDGNALLFDEAIKEAVLKAIGIEPVASKKEKEESESLSPSDYATESGAFLIILELALRRRRST